MYGFLFSTLFFLQAAQPAGQKIQDQQTQAAEMQAIGEMMGSSARSVMLIDPKSRAADYEKAFQALSQEKSTAKVIFQFSDGAKISNVIDLKVMPQNTLMVFRYSTPQGIKFKVVGVENILGIDYE